RRPRAYATLARVRRPATGRLNSGVRCHMGMSAELIAIGPYSEEISEFLDYRAKYYSKIQPGAIVTRRLFGIVEGSTLSREFAALIGISDPWDFNQHKVLLSRLDNEGLRRFSEIYSDYAQDYKAFEALRYAGFEFHFRPEG
ncbi:hypothetical protein, partial [Microcoleus sp. SVA1B1]|uniref:hypothetical protein n=1 Tax=Microcoleus sp. SVA1B1 TaxID=3055422 RepID=UPI002FD7165B